MRYSKAMAENTTEFCHDSCNSEMSDQALIVQENPFYQASLVANIFLPLSILRLECRKKNYTATLNLVQLNYKKVSNIFINMSREEWRL